MIDWSATAAWIALIVAIVTPVLTTFFNNRYQAQVKEREFITTRKLDVIENYLRYASQSSCMTGVSNDFSFYRAVIFLYAPESLHSDISKLNKMIEDTKFSDETARLLDAVAIALRQENKI